MLRLTSNIRNVFVLVTLLQAFTTLAQQKEVIYSPVVENPWKARHVAGAVTATNNGVSLLPSFTLGKPALMFDLSVGNKKISFDPQLRFAMTGKPWSFIFWWRYKVVKTNKWTFNVGAHPAFIFREEPMQVNGTSKDVITSQRYFATEVVPNYWFTKTTSIGMYYLHSNRLDAIGVRSTHFITLNANFNDLPLGGKTFMKFNPQVYYLKMDKPDGYYATSTITLARRGSPWNLQSIMSYPFKTTIIAKSDFIWNVSLIYSFRSEYRKD